MTAYNGKHFIKEAIDSLCNQSYTDWEMLISDDASTDETKLICEEYAKKDPRIKYYRQKENIGMFRNFNFVVNKVNADYFMLASQDDLWGKDFIKVCVEHLESNNEIGMAMTGINQINSHGETLREFPEFNFLSGMPSVFTVSRYVLQPEILGKCLIMYSLFRTEVIKKIWEIYPQRHEWGSDYIFSLAAISHFGIKIDNKILFKKRRGGYADPIKTENEDKMENYIGDPKNHIFPFGRFNNYFRGHIEALQGTPYRLLVAFLLLVRLPRAFFTYLKERNIKKFLLKHF